MKEEERILKVIYRLIKGDASPVHLPVSPVTVSRAVHETVERVLACCKVLEMHGYLTSSISTPGTSPYYYITKIGMIEAQKPVLSLHFYSSPTTVRKRA